MFDLPDPPHVSPPVALAAAGAAWLVAMLVVLLRTGRWSFRLAVVASVVFVGSLGYLFADSVRVAVRAAGGLEVTHPWWLLLLALVPLVPLFAWNNLRGLGRTRKWLAVALRSLTVALLALALAEPRVRLTTENATVIFVIDRSFSVPPDPDPTRRGPDGDPGDRRWERVKSFVDEAVRFRGPDHRDDRAGVILFGRTPRLAAPPAVVDHLSIDERRAGPIDVEYTDVAAALKLALASFPEGTGRRVVLISDGNENLGRAAEQAQLFKQQGVQVDVLPLAAGYRTTDEVLVQGVEAPPATTPGQRLPVRVLVRNANPTRAVTGTLELVQVRGRDQPRFVRFKGLAADQQPGPVRVTARPGLNGFEFLDLPGDAAIDGDSFVYRATFTPDNLPGDRVSNNRATAAVLARGQRRVLVLEDPTATGSHALLVDTLRAAKLRVDVLAADRLPAAGDLGEFLSTYDALLLADVPAERFSIAQMEAVRRQATEQGMGLLMIGGPNSFGPGGYQKTPIEAALPVECDVPAALVSLKGGVVLVLDGPGGDAGNEWKKHLARRAVEQLGPRDMVGVLCSGVDGWYVPFQVVGTDRAPLYRLIDRAAPGEAPDLAPLLRTAATALTDPANGLAVKHCAILSDTNRFAGIAATAAALAEEQVTCANYFPARERREWPDLYARQTRQVSRPFVALGAFTPELVAASGPAADLSAPLPPLHGFVRTTLKPGALPVMAVAGPPADDVRLPVVAYWQPGAGRAVAFTSDDGRWARDWAKSDAFARFWPRAVEWSLRAAETGRVSVFPEVRDGRVRLVVDARDGNEKPLIGVTVKALVSAPRDGAAPPVVPLARTGPGRFEGSFPATEAGAYFVNVRVARDGADLDGRRVGVVVPYSPEFADLEPNPALLRHLAEVTGGEVYPEDDADLARLARAGVPFRAAPATTKALLPLWGSLVVAACVVLLLDVAVRRFAADPTKLATLASQRWQRMRVRPTQQPTSTTPVPADDYMTRLDRAKRRGRSDS